MSIRALPLAGLLVAASQAAAQDASSWDGTYAGLIASTNSGDMIYDDGGPYDLNGSMVGLMLGYNRSNGPWVLGGEISYQKGEVQEVGNPGFLFTSFLDLRGRAGYSFGDALVYGTLGATFSQWDESSTRGLDGAGVLFGLGVDYQVTPRMFIGGEYTRRSITSDWSTGGDTLDADIDTLSIRAGLKF